jgi:ubiquinone/menaquinone biosynthesis C-methylase UbiE
VSEPSHPILAATLDFAMRSLVKVREKVVPGAEGDVLELGAGTGMNIGYYSDAVRSLTAVEPDPHMRKRAERRYQGAGLDVTLDGASAEALPFDDARFDTVVATFVLCTIPDPARALEEARRVLKPGGVLIFAEHVANQHRLARRAQEMLDPVWGAFSGGCHLNRDALELIEAAGFSDMSHRPHGGQRWTLTPVISGRARRG